MPISQNKEAPVCSALFVAEKWPEGRGRSLKSNRQCRDYWSITTCHNVGRMLHHVSLFRFARNNLKYGQVTLLHRSLLFIHYSARNNGGRSENRCVDAMTGRLDMERVSAKILLHSTLDGILFVREEISSVRPGVPCMQYLHHVLIVLKFSECDCCTFPF